MLIPRMVLSCPILVYSQLLRRGDVVRVLEETWSRNHH